MSTQDAVQHIKKPHVLLHPDPTVALYFCRDIHRELDVSHIPSELSICPKHEEWHVVKYKPSWCVGDCQSSVLLLCFHVFCNMSSTSSTKAYKYTEHKQNKLTIMLSLELFLRFSLYLCCSWCDVIKGNSVHQQQPNSSPNRGKSPRRKNWDLHLLWKHPSHDTAKLLRRTRQSTSYHCLLELLLCFSLFWCCPWCDVIKWVPNHIS